MGHSKAIVRGMIQVFTEFSKQIVLEKYLDTDDFYDHKSATNTVNISTVLLITVKVKLILKHVYKKTFQFIHTIKPIDPTYTFVWGLYLNEGLSVSGQQYWSILGLTYSFSWPAGRGYYSK